MRHFAADAAQVVAALQRGTGRLVSLSFRPHRSPRQKVFACEEALILELRRSRRLGIKRLRNELIREHGLKLALATTHKVLVHHGENRLEKPPFGREGRKRCGRPIVACGQNPVERGSSGPKTRSTIISSQVLPPRRSSMAPATM